MQNTDRYYLTQALNLAKIRRGFTAPNPSVGAVLVDDTGNIRAQGYHHAPGSPHAEVVALQQLPVTTEKLTLYVTLEPCCHWGKTPPCTDAILAAPIKRVVYAYRDPHAVVNGKGAEILQAAGVVCEQVALPEIDAFYRSYHYWCETRQPFVTAKIALSLDGKIAGVAGQPVQITGEELRIFTHTARKQADAILTTAKTIYCDNPQLNVRLANEIIAKPLYILDRQLTLPLDAAVFTTAESITLFYAENAELKKKQLLLAKGAQCFSLAETDDGLDLSEAIKHVGQEGRHDLWIEAGGSCFASLLKNSLVQKAFIYVAPLWLGKGKTAFSADFLFNFVGYTKTWRQAGEDVILELDFLSIP